MKKTRSMFIWIIIISLSIFFTTSCNNTGDPIAKDVSEENHNSNGKGEEHKDPIVDRIKEKLQRMTLEEKLGQLLMVGFNGTEMNEELKAYIEDYKVGGLIFFSRNITNKNQSLNLTNHIKKINSLNKPPIFLAIDEEGGKVSRLPDDFIKLPTAEKVGDKNNLAVSLELGKILGLRVQSLGFNLNFAPVLDINSNPKNPVIASRSFGGDPEIVINNGMEVIKGIKSTGVIASPKHFPGHGDTDVDSHIKLPVINKTLRDLKDLELQPFIRAIEEDIDMIMVAHIIFTELDKYYPSTMSGEIITGLLRNELAFDGVVISDDLTMGAIVENYSIEEASREFFKSGGDIALICHGRENPGKVLEAIKLALSTGDLSIEEIDRKVYRILSIKDKYNLEDEIIGELNLVDLNNRTKRWLESLNKE